MTHTFRICDYDTHTLSSDDIANLIYRNDIDSGFICARMAYMSRYRQTYKFGSAAELKAAIDKYCEENNTTIFDYSTFYVNFKQDARLLKIEIKINKTGGDLDYNRLIDTMKRQIRNGTPDEAAVYKKLFKNNDEIQSVAPAMCYLPPYYNSTGDHIGGGIPGHQLHNFKEHPEAYRRN